MLLPGNYLLPILRLTLITKVKVARVTSYNHVSAKYASQTESYHLKSAKFEDKLVRSSEQLHWQSSVGLQARIAS